jgi:hypothetical protein
MKVPDLPPPGVDFKRAHIASDDDDFEVPESLPLKTDTPSEEKLPAVPLQDGAWVGWALVALGLGLLTLASYWSWHANAPSEEPPLPPPAAEHAAPSRGG